MAASFQQRRLSVLSPAKGKISTSSTSSHSSASEFDALFGATSSKQGGGAVKSTASKHTVVISDDDDDSDDDDFETMSLAQRMASVRVSPKQTAAVKDTSLTKVVAKKAIAKKVAAKKVTTSTSAKAKSYTKMKMAELRELLRERGLKETGRKKADLVARLEEADSQGGGAAEEKVCMQMVALAFGIDTLVPPFALSTQSSWCERCRTSILQWFPSALRSAEFP
eukprot:INCI13437.3.p1 GENE.INCI13437.3~~INCI13437.3.p1  ORF type:complete len:224 (+),score=55.45 INCI13437.3:800-1471(+)